MNIDPEFVKTTTKFIDDTLEATNQQGFRQQLEIFGVVKT